MVFLILINNPLPFHPEGNSGDRSAVIPPFPPFDVAYERSGKSQFSVDGTNASGAISVNRDGPHGLADPPGKGGHG